MLILLPPSEGKNQPKGKSALNLSKLAFGAYLLDTRSKLLSKALAKSPVAPAIAVYSGVLYQALDWSSLSAGARKRGERSILIISALFGALRPTDQIPNYKAKIKTPPDLDEDNIQFIVTKADHCKSIDIVAAPKINIRPRILLSNPVDISMSF